LEENPSVRREEEETAMSMIRKYLWDWEADTYYEGLREYQERERGGRCEAEIRCVVPRSPERSESGSESEKERMELQNYLTITTPDAMNAIPDRSTPYTLAIGSRQY
jgi:uncharacterized OB-fold protein